MGALTVKDVSDLSVNAQAPGGHDDPGPGGAARPGYQGVVVTIGDVLVTPDSVLVPRGRFPLAGTTWTVRDTTTVVAKTPRYARVLAAVFGILLVPLLFLRIKKHHLAGAVQVTVVGDGLYHTVSFPPGPESRAHVVGLVNQARALAAEATVAEAAARKASATKPSAAKTPAAKSSAVRSSAAKSAVQATAANASGATSPATDASAATSPAGKELTPATAAPAGASTEPAVAVGAQPAEETADPERSATPDPVEAG